MSAKKSEKKTIILVDFPLLLSYIGERQYITYLAGFQRFYFYTSYFLEFN